MPLYEFACNTCGAHADFVRRIEERNAPAVCPECRGTMHRVIGDGAPLFRFRPRGWKPYDVESAAGDETVEEELCYG